MAAIRSLETAVPPTRVHQSALRDLLREQPGYGRLGRRLVAAAFDGSAIETRHSVLPELGEGADPADPGLFDLPAKTGAHAGTAARNDAYALHAGPLAVEAATKALARAGEIGPSDVTHVITVSCTGFYAPGPDFVLVRELGLRPSTQRFHLGFMGCYASFPALRMAEQFCAADPEAVVLVVSVELCSLHLHTDDDPDAIVAASVFADGAAAAIVTARPAPSGSAVIDLDAFETTIVPEGAAEMAWTVGDEGFDMVLSSYVPKIVEAHIDEALRPLMARTGTVREEVPLWAIHPGGRSIIDRVESTLGLQPAQTAPSRRVLRDFGNMSSASILFVLRDLMRGSGSEPQLVDATLGASARTAQGSQAAQTAADAALAATGTGAGSPTGRAGRDSSAPAGPAHPELAGRRIAAMAFGPGLTVESALMTLRTAR